MNKELYLRSSTENVSFSAKTSVKICLNFNCIMSMWRIQISCCLNNGDYTLPFVLKMKGCTSVIEDRKFRRLYLKMQWRLRLPHACGGHVHVLFLPRSIAMPAQWEKFTIILIRMSLLVRVVNFFSRDRKQLN